MLLTVRANVSLNIRCQSSRSSRQIDRLRGSLLILSHLSKHWSTSLELTQQSLVVYYVRTRKTFEIWKQVTIEEPRVPSTDLDWFVARFDLRYVPRKYSYIVHRSYYMYSGVCCIQQLRWNENAKLDWVMGKTVHTTDPMVLSGCIIQRRLLDCLYVIQQQFSSDFGCPRVHVRGT